MHAYMPHMIVSIYTHLLCHYLLIQAAVGCHNIQVHLIHLASAIGKIVL